MCLYPKLDLLDNTMLNEGSKLEETAKYGSAYILPFDGVR